MERLKKISLRSVRGARLKDLQGYDKGQRLPDKPSLHWLAQVAGEDLKADVEKRFATLRETYGFKRKEMEASIEEGLGTIRTPEFEYSVTVASEENDPSSLVWLREVHPTGDAECLKQDKFLTAFGDLFDSLVCDFSSPASIENLVDNIEDKEPPNLTLDYDSACTWAEIRLQGFAGKVRIDRDHLTVHGGGVATPSALTTILFQLETYFDGDDAVRELQ